MMKRPQENAVALSHNVRCRSTNVVEVVHARTSCHMRLSVHDTSTMQSDCDSSSSEASTDTKSHSLPRIMKASSYVGNITITVWGQETLSESTKIEEMRSFSTHTVLW